MNIKKKSNRYIILNKSKAIDLLKMMHIGLSIAEKRKKAGQKVPCRNHDSKEWKFIFSIPKATESLWYVHKPAPRNCVRLRGR